MCRLFSYNHTAKFGKLSKTQKKFREIFEEGHSNTDRILQLMHHHCKSSQAVDQLPSSSNATCSFQNASVQILLRFE